MPRQRRNLAHYIAKILIDAGWVGIDVDESDNSINSPRGKILSIEGNNYCLKFISYSTQTREYYERNNYTEIIFPRNFAIKNKLYFRGRTGNYQLSHESQFKKIINPGDNDVEKLIIVSGRDKKDFAGGNLVLSKDVFMRALSDAEIVYEKKDSYAKSAENYLSRIASYNYGNEARTTTTYIERGEFSFLVDRLNLPTKRNKRDFERYLDSRDINSLETFLDQLLKNDVFSEDFLRRLNDYFIKEKLKDIITIGRAILALGSTDLSTQAAQKVTQMLNLTRVGQLENLWQKYFEKYLLYLIFSYKKIFPKVRLKNIDGVKKYPDFIGVNHYNGLDVIEIKTHLKNILIWDSSHQNFYFSPEMSKAIVQTMNYLDAIIQQRFQNPDDKNKITSFVEEENLYHPRGIIIISSDKKLTSKQGEEEKVKRDFTKLRNSLHNIEIITFNEIINIADEYIKNIIESPDI